MGQVHQAGRLGLLRRSTRNTGEPYKLPSNSTVGKPTGLTWSDYAGDGNGTQGGVLVPHDYDARLFSSLGAVDEIVLEQNCNVYRSAHGSASVTPSVDDTRAQVRRQRLRRNASAKRHKEHSRVTQARALHLTPYSGALFRPIAAASFTWQPNLMKTRCSQWR